MTLQFPNSPTDGELYTDTTSGNRWVWDNANTVWKSTSTFTQTITVSSTQPGSPVVGQLWWSQDYGRLFVYYDDGNSQQWVEANPADQTAGLVFNTANAAYGTANAGHIVANGAYGRANTALQNTNGTLAGSLSITGNLGVGTSTPLRPFHSVGEATFSPTLANANTFYLNVCDTNGNAGSSQSMVIRGLTSASAGEIALNSFTVNAGVSYLKGYVTSPNQPYARVSKNNGNISGPNVVVFNAANDDTLGMYNTSTGRFTAPVTGRYLFTHGLFSNTGSAIWLKWRVNGTIITTTYTNVTSGYSSAAGCMVLKMNASDYADLYVESGYVAYGNSYDQCWAVFTLLG